MNSRPKAFLGSEGGDIRQAVLRLLCLVRVFLILLLIVGQYSGVYFLYKPIVKQNYKVEIAKLSDEQKNIDENIKSERGIPIREDREKELQTLGRHCKSLFSVYSTSDTVENLPQCLQFIKNWCPPAPCSTLSSEDNVLFYHTFWAGPLGRSQLLSMFSFYRTQRCGNMILWMAPDQNIVNNARQNLSLLYPCLEGRIEVRLGDPTTMVRLAKGTVLEKHATKALEKHQISNIFDDPGSIPYYTDLLRLVLLIHYGGLWVDIDTLFLRDWSTLLRYEFAYRWALQNYINNAVLHFYKNSTVLNALVVNRRPYYRGGWMGKELTEQCREPGGVCPSGLVVFPAAFFDPVWPYVDAGGPTTEPFPFQTAEGDIISFDMFFQAGRQEGKEDNGSGSEKRQFFNGAYAYHWHHSNFPTEPSLHSWFHYFAVKFVGCPLG